MLVVCIYRTSSVSAGALHTKHALASQVLSSAMRPFYFYGIALSNVFAFVPGKLLPTSNGRLLFANKELDAENDAPNGFGALGFNNILPKPYGRIHLMPQNDHHSAALHTSGGFGATFAVPQFPFGHIHELPMQLYKSLIRASHFYLKNSVRNVKSLELGCLCFIGGLMGMKPHQMPTLDFLGHLTKVLESAEATDPVLPARIMEMLSQVISTETNQDTTTTALEDLFRQSPLILDIQQTPRFLDAMINISRNLLGNVADSSTDLFQLEENEFSNESSEEKYTPRVGYVTIPGFGHLNLFAVAKGHLAAKFPNLGLIPLHIDDHGNHCLQVPGIGKIIAYPKTTQPKAHLGGLGDCILKITETGRFMLTIPYFGSYIVKSDLDNKFEANIPGVGVWPISIFKGSRGLVQMKGLGLIPFTITAAGCFKLEIPEYGEVEAEAGSDGILKINVPELTEFVIQGVDAVDLAPEEIVEKWNDASLTDVVVDSAVNEDPMAVGSQQRALLKLFGGPFLNMEKHDVDWSYETPFSIGWGQLNPPWKTGSEEVTEPILEGGHLYRVPPFGDWVWSHADSAAYVLQKLEALRPYQMSAEQFLITVNESIEAVKEAAIPLTPKYVVLSLTESLKHSIHVSPATIEALSNGINEALEGPFPPFEQIANYVNHVVSRASREPAE